MLLILAFVMLLSQNRSAEAPIVDEHEETAQPEIERVSLEDAKAAFDTGTAVFVDVRGVEAYAAAHVVGSVSLPLEEIESRLSELDPNKWIITYCT